MNQLIVTKRFVRYHENQTLVLLYYYVKFPSMVLLKFFPASGVIPCIVTAQKRSSAAEKPSLKHLHCYSPASYFTVFFIHLRLSSPSNFIEMSDPNPNEIVTCEKCGTQTAKRNIVRHMNRFSSGTLFCVQCPSFSTTSQQDLIQHVFKKNTASKIEVTHQCQKCGAKFPSFDTLRQQNVEHENLKKKKQHGKVLQGRKEKKMKIFRKKYKHVSIFLLILKLKKRQLKCSTMHWKHMRLKSSN